MSTSEQTGELLRVAVPNKGALSQAASEILRESGYRQRSDSKELALIDVDNGVEFFYLRPRDIALYVGEGTLDIGITGRDLLRDSGATAVEVRELGFGRSRFHFAGPAGRYSSLDAARGTAHRHVVRRDRASRSSPSGASTRPSPASTARWRRASSSGSPT